MTPSPCAPEQSQAQPLAVGPPWSVGCLCQARWPCKALDLEALLENSPGQLSTCVTSLTPLQFRQFTGGVPDPSSAQTSQKGTSPLVLVPPRPQQG